MRGNSYWIRKPGPYTVVASDTASAVISCPLAATLPMGVGLNPIPPNIAAG